MPLLNEQQLIQWFDLNADGALNELDATMAENIGMYDIANQINNALSGASYSSGVSGESIAALGSEEYQAYVADPGNFQNQGYGDWQVARLADEMGTSQVDLGISSGAIGSRKELGRMLESYKGKTSLIQGAQRQKAIYTIDRFDGGLNLSKSPRDLSYWEACQMDELSPAKAGRLIRL